MLYLPATVAAVLAGFLLQSKFTTAWSGDQIPAQAQFISPKSWAVLDQVAPPSLSNGTTVSLLLQPGHQLTI
jgi:gluconolactonase